MKLLYHITNNSIFTLFHYTNNNFYYPFNVIDDYLRRKMFIVKSISARQKVQAMVGIR